MEEPPEEPAQPVHPQRRQLHAEEMQGPRRIRVEAGEDERSGHRRSQQDRDAEAGAEHGEREGPGEEGEAGRDHPSSSLPAPGAPRRGRLS